MQPQIPPEKALIGEVATGHAPGDELGVLGQ
jgi:hypothetical protein